MIWARASKFTNALILHNQWHDKKKLQVTRGMAVSMSSASAGKLVCVIAGVGGGILDRVLYGEVQPRILLYTRQFWKKRYPFRVHSIDKWYPFHILSLDLCIPFDCCECNVYKQNRIKLFWTKTFIFSCYKIWINPKVIDFFTTIKCIC